MTHFGDELAPRGVLGLTHQEAEVPAWLSRGKPNGALATALAVRAPQGA